MENTLTGKILKNHLVSGDLVPGKPLALKIDQTLTQDATGTMVYLQFAALGIPRTAAELSVSYVDHNTQQADFRNMDDHLFLQSAAACYGVYFSRPGNGICHQVHLERFGVPGKTLLGSDSHTPTAGGLGLLAIGAGGLDVAAAMAGSPFNLVCPEVVGVRLSGSLAPFCGAKDVILHLLGLETVKGGRNKVYEYFGPGIASLSVPERATITNMGAEMGATSSIFPSDEQTRYFLRQQNREAVWTQTAAGNSAAYQKVIEIDLSAIEPLAACPSMPDRVKPLTALAGRRVGQVIIGSCTNSSLADLGVAADILRRKTIAPHVSLGVVPGSRQTLRAAMAAGIIDALLAAGARLLESACGPCIGLGFAPAADTISLRTFNRNFTGRSGAKDDQVYLVGAAAAAAAALTGEISDPRQLKNVSVQRYSAKPEPDDSLIIAPLPVSESSQIKLRLGENIKPCPLPEVLGSEIKATVLLKAADNITTDQIMPAGARVLPLRSNIPEISRFVFADLAPGFAEKAQKHAASIIVAGENYGQGSSREHAAIAPRYLGVRVVLAKSFARIHQANLINFGIVPLTFTKPEDYDKLEEGDVIVLGEVIESLEQKKPFSIKRSGDGLVFLAACRLEKREIEILKAGGLLNKIKSERQPA